VEGLDHRASLPCRVVL